MNKDTYDKAMVVLDDLGNAVDKAIDQINQQKPIAVSLCSTSCDRYLYLLYITDFNDLVAQLKENCYEFETGHIDDFDVESNGAFDTSEWCENLHEECEKNWEKNNQ